MGESVAEATIIKWLKNVGDNIEIDETIVEIATDKVDSEIPSMVKGILEQKLYQENDIEYYTGVYRSKSGEYIIIWNSSTLVSDYHILRADDPKGKFINFTQEV